MQQLDAGLNSNSAFPFHSTWEKPKPKKQPPFPPKKNSRFSLHVLHICTVLLEILTSWHSRQRSFILLRKLWNNRLGLAPCCYTSWVLRVQGLGVCMHSPTHPPAHPMPLLGRAIATRSKVLSPKLLRLFAKKSFPFLSSSLIFTLPIWQVPNTFCFFSLRVTDLKLNYNKVFWRYAQ